MLSSSFCWCDACRADAAGVHLPADDGVPEDDPADVHPSQLDGLHAAVPEAGGSPACKGRRAFYRRRDPRRGQQGTGAQRGRGWSRGRALPGGGDELATGLNHAIQIKTHHSCMDFLQTNSCVETILMIMKTSSNV